MATGHLPGNIFMVCGLLIIASCLGNMNGYWLGLKAGRIMYIRKESRFFKRKHLAAAVAFYIKHGNWSLAAGLFFLIIRTFAPVVSGMIQLKFNRFVLFTFLGSALWIISFVMTGYLAGIMPFLKPYLKYLIIGIFLTVTTPAAIGIFKNLNKK